MARGASTPDELAARLIGGITYDELPFRSAGAARRRSRRSTASCSRRCPTTCSRATRPPGSTTACRSTRWRWRRAGASRSTTTRSTATTRCSRERGHTWSDELGGTAHLEGGDVLVIGNGCVLVGMGERTRPAGVERLAEALFEAGSARQVIAVDMPAQRSTMHLDTVMTMVDRDAFTIYPDVRQSLVGYSLRPVRVGRHRRARGRPLRRDRACARRPGAAAVRDRRRPLRGAARAVGRRQQRPGRGAGRRRRLRAQRRHQHAAAPRGDRGDHDRRLRAGARSRRPPLHVLPDRARALPEA